MRKASWIVVVLMLASILVFSACDKNENPPIPNETANGTSADIATGTETTETEAHIHAFGEWFTITDATCADVGKQERTCACGEKESQSIDALGHTEVVDAAVAPTCTETGLTEGKHCSVCNETIVKQKAVNILDHIDGEWVVDQAATCTENGSRHKECTVCKTTTQRDTLLALGHKEGEWILDRASTCVEKGSRHKECSVCLETVTTETLLLVDHIDGEWVVDQAATCTENGSKHQVCSVCETTIKTETLPKVGHTEVTDEMVAPTCTEPGLTEGKHCLECGLILVEQQFIAAIGHDYATTAMEPLAEGNICVTHTCTICNDSYQNIVFPAHFTVTSENRDMVGYTESVENLVIPMFFQSQDETWYRVTAIGDRAFRLCNNLVSINIPDSLTSIGNSAFNRCTGLTSITIGNGVTSIGESAFDGCTGLTSITIPDSVTNISKSAFRNCSSLRNITIPFVGATIDGTSNTHFGYIFGAFSASTNSSYVPSSLKTVMITGGTSIDGYAFNGCKELESIAVGNSVTSIGERAFYGCTGLMNITLGNNVSSIGERAFNECTGLTSVTIPDRVTSIGYYAFNRCTGLTSITIGNGVTSIGERAFSECTGLANITIGNSVISIGEDAFNGCTGLTNITIPDSVMSIGEDAFFKCTGLTSITIPNNVTNIGYSAFYGCLGLTSITIPFVGATIDGTSNTHFGYIFGASSAAANSSFVPSSLKTVMITGGTSIGYYAFNGCTGLTSITIGNSVTSIGERAFNRCTGLTSITIGNGVKNIGSNAFFGCMGLKSITIPDNVTRIDSWAFSECTGLTNITIPDSMKSIGEYALYGCTGLDSINYGDTVEKWKAISKGNNWNNNVPATEIQCSDGTVSLK